MKTIHCKVCQLDVPEENYSLRMNNGKLGRYGKTCDNCRKLKNNLKYSSEEFKTKNREKQNAYNKKRFFYSRAAYIVNRAKKEGKIIEYNVIDLCKHLVLLWRQQLGLCLLSGDKLTRDNAQVDHIVASSNNGDNHFNNFRWVTKDCNIAKGNLSDDELKNLIIKMYNKVVLHQ